MYLFYPHYIDVKGKTKPYEENVLKEEFPLTYNYIVNFKGCLEEKKSKIQNKSKAIVQFTSCKRYKHI